MSILLGQLTSGGLRNSSKGLVSRTGPSREPNPLPARYAGKGCPPVLSQWNAINQRVGSTYSM